MSRRRNRRRPFLPEPAELRIRFSSCEQTLGIGCDGFVSSEPGIARIRRHFYLPLRIALSVQNLDQFYRCVSE